MSDDKQFSTYKNKIDKMTTIYLEIINVFLLDTRFTSSKICPPWISPPKIKEAVYKINNSGIVNINKNVHIVVIKVTKSNLAPILQNPNVKKRLIRKLTTTKITLLI